MGSAGRHARCQSSRPAAGGSGKKERPSNEREEKSSRYSRFFPGVEPVFSESREPELPLGFDDCPAKENGSPKVKAIRKNRAKEPFDSRPMSICSPPLKEPRSQECRSLNSKEKAGDHELSPA